MCFSRFISFIHVVHAAYSFRPNALRGVLVTPVDAGLSFLESLPSLQVRCHVHYQCVYCYLAVQKLTSSSVCLSGIITSIPDAVIGGMTIFLFANVLTSGIALAATLDLHSRRIK